jgi:predicted nucleotidyltransferase
MSETVAVELTTVLAELLADARAAFDSDLLSVVLFGSAAEGRWRPSSDVNLLFLLARFDPPRIDAFRSSLRAAHAALRIEAMFLLKEELPVAVELFALKFSDMATRHRVLFGPDPLTGITIDETDLRRRLREVLLNLALRLRSRYALVSQREEQLAKTVADTAGPLRAAAGALLRLRGDSAVTPREALERLTAEIGEEEILAAVGLLPQARQDLYLPAGTGKSALLALARLAGHLRRKLEQGSAA